MRKKIIAYVMLLAALPLSCNTDFLETEPVGLVPAETTWTDGPLSEAFVFGIYSFLGYGGFEEQMLASYTDEAMFTHAGRSINTFTEGTESPSNLAWTSATYEWDDMFNAIRAANTAIANLPNSTFEDPSISKDMLLGEAYFLRAYYYHQLLRYYGGFPIITQLYDIDSDYQTPRNTFAECVEFIVTDLDEAALLLDGKPFIRGRANKLAAQALKARVLLYAASDLRDMTTAAANSPTLAAYGNKDLIGYTSGDRTARWEAARDAAKVVLDATTGYKLDLDAPVSPEEGTENYVALSMGGGSNAADKAAAGELLFERTHTPLYTVENDWPLGGIHFGINNGPNGYHNWAGNTPIQQLVDDYEVMDGSDSEPFDWNDPDHASAPYDNRDPRFYATILYDGADWKPRPSDVAGIDPVNQIQTGYYDNGAGGMINGVDTRESAIENWNGSRTHYYTRKFIDPDPAVVENQSGFQVVPWPFIRYTEVVLNYVEALIELGEDEEARTWLNKIRFRAGMPAITESGDALMERYRNERRIELVYEEHRYHDVRRWMIPAETVGRGVKSIHIEATLKGGQTPHVPYRYDPAKYTYEYTVEDNTSNEVRTWVDKMYFRPIPRNEVNINTALVQNPGYE
ncbi:MAG TPA: RagB/SusD family nutrient uptake outer membrane protein [Ohtaekwangia sp.]|nr:RagB/SusD family nutrient uptake outer membrane protein [Ohtaekwangia sp.]